MQMYPVPPNAKYGGETDRFIGEWIKGIQRDKIILATKVWYAEDCLHSVTVCFSVSSQNVIVLASVISPSSPTFTQPNSDQGSEHILVGGRLWQ